MSRENVELARRAIDAVNRQDLDALLALNDPEVVAVPRTLGVEGGTYHGHEGVRAWWDGIFSAFPDFKVEVISVRGTGEMTLANLRVRGHGEGSGAPFEDVIWQVARARDGRVVWWQTFGTEDEALEAVGLRE
jgi:ketosteroid isomerase-like protein